MRVDALVAGAGVAGSLCARQLAAGGARVLLVNRRGSEQRGEEMISARGRRLIGAPVPDGVEIVEVVSLWSGSVIRESAIVNPWGRGISVDRGELDAALRDAAARAGATVVDGTVRGAQRTQRGWRVALKGESVEASLLVVANGRSGSSLVRRRSAAMKELAVMARVSTRSDPRLYVERAGAGWWYALPSTIAFCTWRATERPLALWRREMAKTRLMRELAGNPLSLFCRAAGMRWFDKVAGDGWLAVGDAAFACHPLSGMGMEFGAESASRAAAAASSHAAMRSYAAWVAEWARHHAITGGQFWGGRATAS